MDTKYIVLILVTALLAIILKNVFVSQRNRKQEELKLLLERIRDKMARITDAIARRELDEVKKRSFVGLGQIDLDSQTTLGLKKIEEQLEQLLPSPKREHEYKPGETYVPTSVAKEKELLARARAHSKSKIAQQEDLLKEARRTNGLGPRRRRE